MARILIGWELGAGNGHVSRLLELASILARRGHDVSFAPQQVGAFAAHGPTWQAPVWPGLLEPLLRHHSRRPQTMGDNLAYLGLDDPAAVIGMILAWDRLIGDARPDVVVAEYAPMLQLAARGRVPLIAFGTGYSLPPAHLPHFPALFGDPAVVPEPALLATVNAALGRCGRPPLAALPEIFVADRSLVATFAELDPYRKWRRDPVAAPAICGPVPQSTGEGEEVFVYFNGPSARPNAFWQALVDCRLPVRVYDTLLNHDDVAMLEGAGIKVERGPVAFDRIVERSRLLLSHGGMGFVSSGMVAGVPQIVIPFDGEKLLVAGAVAGQSGCLQSSFEGLRTDAYAALLRAAWSDTALRKQAQAAAPGLRARMTSTAETDVADLVDTMV